MSIFQILVIFLFIIIFIFPIIMAGMSKKVKGNEKAIFFFLSLFLGWVGYLPYYLIVVRHKINE